MKNYTSNLGYLDYSPYKFNPYNIINSNNITMNGVSKNLLLIPNKGKAVFAKANSGNYYFPNASRVTEIPIYQKAGTVYDNPIFDTRLLQKQNYSSDSRMIENLKVAAEQVKKQNDKENFVKQQYISQSNPKSKLDILKNSELNKQYVYSHPYSKLNNNGDIEQKYPDRNIEGTAIPYSNAAKLDKGLNTLSKGIDAASILTGLYGLGKYAIRNAPKVIGNISNIEKGIRGVDDLGIFTMKEKNKYYNLNEGFVNNKISVSKPNYLRYEKEPLVSKNQFLDSDDKINKYYNDFYSGKIPEDLMFFDYRGSSFPGIKRNNMYLEFNPLEETRKDLAKIAIHKNNLSDSKVPFSNSYTDEFIKNNPKFFINEELKNYKNKPFKTSEFKLRRNKYGGLNSYQKGGQLFQPPGLRKPIFTNNPNDPRIRAYQDSLNLYNDVEKEYQDIKRSGIGLPGTKDEMKVKLSSEKLLPYNQFTNDYENGKKKFRHYNNGTNEYMDPQNISRFRGTGVLGFFDYFNQARFKKPEQPVIYQPSPINNISNVNKPIKKPVQPVVYQKPQPKTQERAPIVVTNPNDPRLKAYNDSLSAYNLTQTRLKQALNKGEISDGRGKNIPVYSVAERQYLDRKRAIETDFEKYKKMGLNLTKKDIEDEYKQIDYKKGQVRDDAVGYYRFKHKNDAGSYTLADYKKPVQPVVYKKEEKLLKRNTTPQALIKANREDLKIIPNSLNIPLNTEIPNLPYQVDYFDPVLKQRTSKYFPSDVEGAEFLKDLDPATGLPEYRNRGDNYVRGFYNKFQDGGNLPCLECGGNLKKYQGIGTSFVGPRNQNWLSALNMYDSDIKPELWKELSLLNNNNNQVYTQNIPDKIPRLDNLYGETNLNLTGNKLSIPNPNENSYAFSNFSLNPIDKSLINGSDVLRETLYATDASIRNSKNNMRESKKDKNFNYWGSGLNTILAANGLLRWASNNKEESRKYQNYLDQLNDNNFNPTYSNMGKDYGYDEFRMLRNGGKLKKYQDGGDDSYDEDNEVISLLFDNKEESSSSEKDKITESDINNQRRLLEKERKKLIEQQEELENDALINEIISQQSRKSNYYGEGEVQGGNFPSSSLEKAQVYKNYLIENHGLSNEQASGFLGNLYAESSLNPSITNPTSGAFGLAQWLGSRKKSLLKFAKDNGKDVNDPFLQLDFAVRELNTTHKNSHLDYNSPKSATVGYLNKFEKPSEEEKRKSFAKRVNFANSIYQQGGTYDLSLDELQSLINQGYKIKYL